MIKVYTDDLKNLCISNLILIILNDKYSDAIRKYAEIELRSRIKKVGCHYDELLHFDDKVINKRGLDIENYIIKPDVNYQELLETYFNYSKDTDWDTNGLLFSEKHLCNDCDIGESFFRKICKIESKNINKRLNSGIQEDIDALKQFKEIYRRRLVLSKETLKEALKEEGINGLFTTNDAEFQMDNVAFFPYDFWANRSPEEEYKILKSKFKMNVYGFIGEELIGEYLFEPDIFNDMRVFHLTKKDEAKLKNQKRRLLLQAKYGPEINYETDSMKLALKNKNKYLDE